MPACPPPPCVRHWQQLQLSQTICWKYQNRLSAWQPATRVAALSPTMVARRRRTTPASDRPSISPCHPAGVTRQRQGWQGWLAFAGLDQASPLYGGPRLCADTSRLVPPGTLIINQPTDTPPTSLTWVEFQ